MFPFDFHVEDLSLQPLLVVLLKLIGEFDFLTEDRRDAIIHRFKLILLKKITWGQTVVSIMKENLGQNNYGIP